MTQKFEFLDRAIEAARHCEINCDPDDFEFPIDKFPINDYERLYAQTLITSILGNMIRTFNKDQTNPPDYISYYIRGWETALHEIYMRAQVDTFPENSNANDTEV